MTLPDPTQCVAGSDILIINVADQDLTVGYNELVIAKNSLVADSVAFTTSGEKIGAAVMCVSTGAKWCILPMVEEAVSMTVTVD